MTTELEILTHQPETVSAATKKKNLGHLAAESRKRVAERRRAAEPKAPEHIGHVLIAAEAAAKQPGSDKRIDTLNRAELFDLSDKIILDGTSLRQIYESHLIAERGLRRLVTEYVRGGDLKKALRQEITEREIDFERDPALRDMTPQLTAPIPTHPNSAALNKLLEKVSIEGSEAGEAKAFYKARAHYEIQQLQQHQQRRRLTDVAMVLTILLLIALIIGLYLSRH